MALAALALVVFGAIEGPPSISYFKLILFDFAGNELRHITE